MAKEKIKNSESEAFADRLNEALDDLGVPPINRGRQTELKQMMGLTQEAVRKWLAAEAMPSVPNMVILAKKLNVCFEWLATGRTSKGIQQPIRESMILQNHSPEEQAWLDFYRRMNADQRKTARQIIEWCLNIVDTEMRYALEGKEKRRYYDKDNGK